ncbi:hypothetical protein ACFQE8_09195 [Salinirubellus sp. GCM10025818]|uniref:DUF7534 family protein n=1 Tax=Salinirubellus TaxID=2162630 RepID=UPI0030D44154
MSLRLPPELLPTALVLVFVSMLAGAYLTPPDPYTQLSYLGISIPMALGLAVALTYGGGFDRLGWSPDTGDHVWTAVVVFTVATLVGVLVPDPTAPLVHGAGLLVGLAVGAWLGWGEGRERLRFRSRNA